VTSPTDRLHETARRAVALAFEDARGRGHRHLGTGHLLMGVLGTPDGAGARVLGRLDVTVHDVDAELVRVVGYGVRAAPPGCDLGGATEDAFGASSEQRRRWSWRRRPVPLSAAAAAALRSAVAATAAAVGTDHLVLGLLASTDGLAHRMLVARGVSEARVRAAVTRSR
jgi:ATP-dependent Clp protease ATP-binding subunit ClpC